MSEPPPRQTFLQRAPVRKFLRRALANWLERHQHPFNRGIHFLGIPMSMAGVVIFFTLPWRQWYWGVGAFAGGYVLQWIGHLVEGNDVGEWAAVKRMLGLPYVAIAPRTDERMKVEGEH